jgi:hypothetical protein
MLTLDVGRVKFMIRYHKQLNENFKYVCAVFDYKGGELLSKRRKHG